MSGGTPAEEAVDWERIAKRKWPDAYILRGNGPFAVLAYCPRAFTICLYETREAADAAKAVIDRLGCGGRCQGASEHVVVEMKQPRKARTKKKDEESKS
jgi:hypothetical protein